MGTEPNASKNNGKFQPGNKAAVGRSMCLLVPNIFSTSRLTVQFRQQPIQLICEILPVLCGVG